MPILPKALLEQQNVSHARLAGELSGEFHQAPYGNARWALRDPWFVFFRPRRAGDIEVQPRSVFGKFLEEHRGVDGAAPTPAGVDDIRDIRTDIILVLFVERKPPEFLACLIDGTTKALVHFVVIREYAGVHIAECDDDCASQRGRIDQMSASQLAGIEEAVREHQSAFSVGVDNLNGFAGHGNLYVAGLLRLPRRHVFSGADNRDNPNLGFQQGDRSHGANHCSRAGHVILHFFHAISGLDRDPSGIEGHAFADQPKHRICVRVCRFVAQYNERGRFIRSLGHAPEGAHLQLFQFVSAVDFYLQTNFLRHFSSPLGEDGRRHVVAGLIDQFTSEILRLTDDASLVHRFLQLRLIATSDDGQEVDLLILAVALIGIGIEVADERPFYQSLYRFVALNVLWSHKREAANSSWLEVADCNAGQLA